MAITVLPIDADPGTGQPAYTAQQTRQAFSAFAGIAPSGRPLGANSGVRAGTPNQTLTSGTSTQLTYSQSLYNIGGIADTTNSQFTVPAGWSGIYMLTAQLRWTGTTTSGTMRKFWVNVNGSTLAFDEMTSNSNTVVAGETNHLSTELTLNAGDVVTFYAFQNSGSNLDVASTVANAGGTYARLRFVDF